MKFGGHVPNSKSYEENALLGIPKMAIPFGHIRKKLIFELQTL
jgi:hypothetical protein